MAILMTPCPDRQRDFDRFCTTGEATIEYDAHMGQCQRCQQAFEHDWRIWAMIESVGRMMLEPQQPNAVWSNDE